MSDLPLLSLLPHFLPSPIWWFPMVSPPLHRRLHATCQDKHGSWSWNRNQLQGPEGTPWQPGFFQRKTWTTLGTNMNLCKKKTLFKRKIETQISGWTSRAFSTARSTRRKNTTPMGLNHLASCLEWLDNTPCQLQCCGQRWCSYLGHYSSPFYCWSKWHKSIMIYKTNMSRGFDP